MAPKAIEEDMAQVKLVLLTDVLEHVSDDFALLSSLMNASEPGTHFLVTVPADESLWSQHDESFGHFRRYDLPRFRRLWQGLSVDELLASAYNARLFPLVKGVRKWNRWRGEAAGEAAKPQARGTTARGAPSTQRAGRPGVQN